MDADYSTPAARYFDDISMVLKESEDGSRDAAILWLSFWESNGYVNLGVYSDFERKYTHQFKGRTKDDVIAFLKGVEKDYGVKIPKEYYETSGRFLELAPQSFGLSEVLYEPEESCGQCGDFSSDEVEAFFFPPLVDGGDASLAVHMRYGCYDSVTVAGSFNEALVHDAIGVLEDAKDKAESSSVRNEISDFIHRIRSLA